MDNPDHKDKTVDNTSTIQSDVLNIDEMSPPENVGDPKNIEEPMAAESEGSSEDQPQEPSAAEHVTEPESIEEAIPEEPMTEENTTEESTAEESTTGEPSSDEVRTARVTIRGQNRSAHFDAGEHTLKPGDEVVVQTKNGKAIGEVTEPPVVLGCRGCKHMTILRKATPEEITKDLENRELEKEAFEYCMKTIDAWEIPMRLVQVEFLFDRSKAVFYFTAEKRVDFRELVRTLAREFSTRIEMKQIGIRDEARLLGGIGPCGMSFCCSTFLKEFAPISVKMAKEQNVILNPNKISGGCGRLLCCLNYEYEQYREASRGVPKIGKKVNLPEGSGKVRSIDIFSRTVTIDMTDAKPLVIDIDELREKLK